MFTSELVTQRCFHGGGWCHPKVHGWWLIHPVSEQISTLIWETTPQKRPFLLTEPWKEPGLSSSSAGWKKKKTKEDGLCSLPAHVGLALPKAWPLHLHFFLILGLPESKHYLELKRTCINLWTPVWRGLIWKQIVLIKPMTLQSLLTLLTWCHSEGTRCFSLCL